MSGKRNYPPSDYGKDVHRTTWRNHFGLYGPHITTNNSY